MTQVVLIRPGATLYDEQNRVQGALDIPLSERGRAETSLSIASPLNHIESHRFFTLDRPGTRCKTLDRSR